MDDPSAAALIDNLLAAKKAKPINETLIHKLGELLIKVLANGARCPFRKTATANTRLPADIIHAWGLPSKDPDASSKSMGWQFLQCPSGSSHKLAAHLDICTVDDAPTFGSELAAKVFHKLLVAVQSLAAHGTKK